MGTRTSSKEGKKSLPHRVSKQFQSSKVVVFESGKASKLSKTRSGLAQHSGRSTHGLRLRSAPNDLNCTFHVGARQTRTSAKWLNCLFRTTHARTQREASEGTMASNLQTLFKDICKKKTCKKPEVAWPKYNRFLSSGNFAK